MPRLNLRLLVIVAIVSLLCYRQADSAHRSRYGRMLGTFVDVLEQIERRYIEPTDDRELFEAALKGMVGELHDPNSAYYDPHAASQSRAHLQQQFGGIGIEVSFDRKTGQIVVLTPLPGAPAYEAGVLAGDRIVKINDDNTSDFKLEDVTKHLRGKPGTTVRLSVLHEGETEPAELTMRRAIIQTDTVLGDHRRADGDWDYHLEGQSQIGYVRLTLFGKKTTDELRTVLDQLQTGGMRGLILDLRNNHGGLLDAAERTCDLFVPMGRIVSTRGRDGAELKVRDAIGNAPFAKLPVVVLINQHSASASEVVAGCLQDHDRATIVGVRSYGKGTVQDVIPLENGQSELRLTIATYWRPSGHNIHRHLHDTDDDPWGVSPTPGYEVPLTDEQLAAVFKARRQRDLPRPATVPKEQTPPEPAADDPQLAKALATLLEEMSAHSSSGMRENAETRK